jgi:hypothetical protein
VASRFYRETRGFVAGNDIVAAIVMGAHLGNNPTLGKFGANGKFGTNLYRSALGSPVLSDSLEFFTTFFLAMMQ